MGKISKTLFVTTCLLSINAHGEIPSDGVKVVTDITLSCYMTALKSKSAAGQISYGIISSSPRDCGVIDRKTGRLDESKTRIFCPRGYRKEGFVRGGAVGASGDNIFYKADGLCITDYSFY